MKESIKTKILNFLQDGDWKFGGQIEDFIRSTDGHKSSNASRRCRELEEEGKIERRLVKFKGLNVVQYRIRVDQVITPFIPCCYSFHRFKVHDRTCKEFIREKALNTLF